MKNDIVVVKIDPDIPYEQYAAYEDLLTTERKERIARFRHNADRIRSFAAGILLGRALKAAGKADALLVTGQHGKPLLKDCDDFFFSISHAGEYVALATSPFSVGLDIERVQLREAVARRFYASREVEAVRSARAPEKTFTKIWTRKEAYIKYTGRGLQNGLDQIRVLDPDFCREQEVSFDGRPVADGTYYLSLCCREEGAFRDALSNLTSSIRPLETFLL